MPIYLVKNPAIESELQVYARSPVPRSKIHYGYTRKCDNTINKVLQNSQDVCYSSIVVIVYT